MTSLLIVLAIVATAGVVAAFLIDRRNPERASGHGSPDAMTTSERLYETADRPAGPDAETMDPDQLGGDHRPPT